MKLASSKIQKEPKRKASGERRGRLSRKSVRERDNRVISNDAPAQEVRYVGEAKSRGSNILLEVKSLLSICVGTQGSRDLLSKLKPTHFHTPELQVIFKRVRFLASRTGEVPDYQTLINDPCVTVVTRDRIEAIAAENKIVACKNGKQFVALYRAMDAYAKKRALYEAINKVAAELRTDGSDADTAIMRFKQEALRLSSGFDAGTIDMIGGAVDLGLEFSDLERIARGVLSHVDSLHPSGFNAYDNVNIGLPEGGAILFGAETGDYKSVMMLQHAIFQARNGKRIAFYSLEMTREQLMERVFANVIRLDVLKARREGTLLPNVEKYTKRVLEEMSNWWGNTVWVCPAEDVSWEWVAEHLSSLDVDTGYVDYLGLLSGIRSDGNNAQWQSYDAIMRNVKVYTNATKRTVVMAAQMRFVDGLPELKYAKAMKDHVNVMWAWHRLEVDDRTFLCVHADKVRGGKRIRFVLEVEPEYSYVRDINRNDKRAAEIAEQAVMDMNARKDPCARYMKDGAQAKPQTVMDESGKRKTKTFDGVKLVEGRFTPENTNTVSYDVSAKSALADERAARAKHAASIASAGASSLTALAEQRERIARQAQVRARALAKLAAGKLDNLTHEEMMAQGEEVLRQWEQGKQETVYGFDVLAKELIELQTHLKGLKDTVDSSKYPETAALLSNERNKSFAKRATKKELTAHKRRIDFVRAAIAKRDELKAQRTKLRIDHLLLTARDRESRDGSHIMTIADPATLKQEWQTNAVIFEDRGVSTLPNSAKPVEKRWQPTKDAFVQAANRRKRYRESDTHKLVSVRWPKVERLHYLTDAQLDMLVEITNRWDGVPRAAVIGDNAFKKDIARFTALVAPSRERQYARVDTVADMSQLIAKYRKAYDATTSRRITKSVIDETRKKVSDVFGKQPKERTLRSLVS